MSHHFSESKDTLTNPYRLNTNGDALIIIATLSAYCFQTD